MLSPKAVRRPPFERPSVTDTRLDARIADIRQFNRFYTKQIGVLQEGLLESDLSLAELLVLYELAHDDTASLLEGRPVADQRALIDAMHTIERILGRAEPAPRRVELRDPRPGDMLCDNAAPGEIYTDEYGWTDHFEALVAQIV